MKEHSAILWICLAFLLAGIFRFNDLSFYTPDSNRYLIWGNSLAHGKGFIDETLPDPDPYVVHAPLYPLLIAPVEMVAPYSVVGVKAWTLLWGVAAVLLAYLWLYHLMGKKSAIIGSLLFAANPFFWLYSTEVLSDAPFVAALMAVLYLVERMRVPQECTRSRMVLLGTAALFATMVREVGATVAIAAIVYLVLIRRPKAATIILLIGAVLIRLWYLRNNVYASTAAEYAGGNIALIFRKIMTGPQGSILNEFALRLWLTFQSYSSQVGQFLWYPMFAGHFGSLFFNPTGFDTAVESLLGSLGILLEIGTIAGLVIGGIIDLRSGSTARLRTIFLVVYGGAILLYPINDLRFLVPLIPFFILYILRFVKWITEKIVALAFIRESRIAFALTFVLLIPNLVSMYEMVHANLLYASHPESFYSSIDDKTMYTSLYARPWSALGEWVEKHLDSNAVIVSPYKQLATVVGSRKVLILDKGITLPQFEENIRDYRVAFIVAPRRWGSIKVFESQMMESRRYRFQPVFSIGDLHLFHISSGFCATNNPEDPSADTANSPSTQLREGWREFARGNYASAHSRFLQAMAMAPEQPEIVYHAMVTSSVLDDSLHARELYRRLYAAPQAGSYLEPAAAYLAAMDQFNATRSVTYQFEVSVQSLKAASAYWRLGAYHRAASIMNTSIRSDTGYFVGLLWALYYNLELGDTNRAKSYLAMLDNLDPKNPVAVAFAGILAKGDSLVRLNSAADRSALHLRLAAVYQNIVLPEAAFDQAEIARCENPENAGALLFMARMLELRSRFPAALETYRDVLALDPLNQFAHAKIDSLSLKIKRTGS